MGTETGVSPDLDSFRPHQHNSEPTYCHSSGTSDLAFANHFTYLLKYGKVPQWAWPHLHCLIFNQSIDLFLLAAELLDSYSVMNHRPICAAKFKIMLATVDPLPAFLKAIFTP